MQKNLSLIIKANQEFVRHTGEDEKLNASILSLFYETISNTYLPLLRMIENLAEDKVNLRIGVVLPPVLCTLLADKNVQASYAEYLEKRMQLGLKELERNSQNEKIKKVIQSDLDEIERLKFQFTAKYDSDLIHVFADFMQKGYIELLGTCGTEIFMPHFADMKEIISAQIECGLHSFREYFGIIPDGFWLPELGYTPGVEKLIKAYGYNYIIIDSRSLLLAEKIPDCGIFYPSRTENSLLLFTQCRQAEEQIIGEEGFVHNPAYKNVKRDIGYELSKEELAPFMTEGDVRYSTGYKYWNRCFDDEKDNIYDFDAAEQEAKKDALTFLESRKESLDQAALYLDKYDFVTQVVTLDTDKVAKIWSENLIWLENVIREAGNYGLTIASCNQMCHNQYSLEKIAPYYSASCGAGYGENLLSSKNCWMMRYIRKACERMIDLSDRFPTDTGLKTRLLNLGATELLLAQSSKLAAYIEEAENVDFAERRFKESITAFTQVFDSLGSNTVSTEWLTTLEVRDSIFPWMNYRIFSKKR